MQDNATHSTDSSSEPPMSDTIDTEIDKLLLKHSNEVIASWRDYAEYGRQSAQEHADKCNKELHPQTRKAISRLITKQCNEARVDENESLLSVAEYEIELGDKCYNHEKHTPACYACRKRKMYVEYSKDWKKSISERIAELKRLEEEK